MTEYFRFGAVRIVVCFVVVVVVVIVVLLLSCFMFRLLSGIYTARLCISRYFAIFRLLFCLVFFADFVLRAFLFFANLVAFLGILQLCGLLRRFTILSLGFFYCNFFFLVCNLHSSEANVDSHVKWLHVRMRHFCSRMNQYQR